MARWNSWSIWGGLAFIGLGLLILLGQLLHINVIGMLWPLFIIAIGGLFFAAMLSGGRDGGAFAIPGSVIVTVGLILLVQNLLGLWATWAYAWALIIAAAGVGLILFGTRSGIPELRVVGRVVITVGLVLFFVFGLFFELGASLLGLRSPGGVVWPVLLILLGLYVLAGRPLFERWGGAVSRSAVGFNDLAVSEPGTSGAVIEGSVRGGTVDAAQLSGVRRLRFHGLGDIAIVQGEREGLDVEASEAAKERIIIQARSDTLEIRFKEDWWNWMMPAYWNMGRIRFTWYTHAVESILGAGLGNIEADGLAGQRLEIRQDGTGSITLRRLSLKELVIDQSGLGNVTLDGQVDRQDVTISGTGSYHAGSLSSCSARVSLSGLGSARVAVSEDLDARLSGTGSIEYMGNPCVNQHVSGLGSVRRIR